MKIIFNQHGYTLLLTLILVVIISAFIGTLSFLTLTQQIQVEKTDDQFLLSDISEMGLEHYRARVMNDYKTKANEVQKALQEFASNEPNLTEQKLQEKAEQLEKNALNKLAQSFSAGNAENSTYKYITTTLNDNDNFELLHMNTTSNESEKKLIITLRLKSNILNDTSYIDGVFTLPLNLIDFSITYPGDGQTATDIVPVPDFTTTVPNPFLPDNPVYCVDSSSVYGFQIVDQKCVTTLGQIFYDFENSIIFVKGFLGMNGNILYLDQTNYKNSKFYLNVNSYAYSVQSVSNVSFFTNQAFFLENAFWRYYHTFNYTNVLIQANKGIQVKSNISINNSKFSSGANSYFEKINGNGLTLYSAGNTYFNDSVILTDSQLRSSGTVIATNKSINLTNSYFLLEGENNSIGTLTVKGNSKVCFQDTSTISSLNILENGEVNVLEGTTINTNVQSGSKQIKFLQPEAFSSMCKQHGGTTKIDVTLDGSTDIDDVITDIQYGNEN